MSPEKIKNLNQKKEITKLRIEKYRKLNLSFILKTLSFSSLSIINLRNFKIIFAK